MKLLNFIANPIFLLMAIGSFIYVYFFYLAEDPVRNRETVEAEAEFTRSVVPQAANNATTPVAGIAMKQESPFNFGNDQRRCFHQIEARRGQFPPLFIPRPHVSREPVGARSTANR